MGKEKCYLSCNFNTGEKLHGWRVNLSITGQETGMLTCSTIICFGNGCSCHMHHASMYTGPVEGILDAEPSMWHSFVTIFQRYHVFHRKLGGGSKESVHFVRPIRGFLGSAK